jgi:hypothetical protein
LQAGADKAKSGDGGTEKIAHDDPRANGRKIMSALKIYLTRDFIMQSTLSLQCSCNLASIDFI